MNTKKSPEEIQSAIDLIKDLPGVPSWILDANNYGSDAPLSPEELYEFAEFHTGQLRVSAALYYLNACADRFGHTESGQLVFRAQGLLSRLTNRSLKPCLFTRLNAMMDEKPEERYLAPMRFYQLDEINRKEKGSTWLVDFIDGVFIHGTEELKDLLSESNGIMH
jgi:hypothetical protein